MSRFITLRSSFDEVYVNIQHIGSMYKSEESTDGLGFFIYINVFGQIIYLEYGYEHERDEAYKEIKALIEELTE